MLGSFPLWSLGATSNDVGRYVSTRPRRHQPHRPHQHRPAPHRMRLGPLPPSPVPSAASSRLTLQGPSFQLPNFPSVNRTRRWRQAWWAPKTLAPGSWWAGQGSCEHGSWDLGHGTCCVLRAALSRRSISYIWSGAPQPPQLKHLLLLFTVPVPVHRTDRASHFPFSSISTFFRLFPLACHILFFVSFVTSTSGIRKLDREPPSNRTPFVGVSESSLRLFIPGPGIQYRE